MARRHTGIAPLIGIVVVAFGLLATVLLKGWSPALGLDLQGGASVVYQAANDVPDQALDDAIEIIRNRVDSLGVAEPEIIRQGDAIVVNLPGVADRDRALEVIGRTAELRFRPVLTSQPYITPEQLEAVPSSTTSTTVDPAATTSTTEASALGAGLTEGEFAAALPSQDPTTTTTVDPAATTTTTAPVAGEPIDTDDGCVLLGGTTPPDDDVPEATVVLPDIDSPDDEDDFPQLCYELGPVPTDGENSLVGSIVVNPEKQIQSGEWGVSLSIRSDDLDLFNETAAECFNRGPTCPTGQLAITLDGEVQSAPSINEPSFSGQGLVISGSFTEREAGDLALVLRFGALPVELEAQTVQTVSATLGEDSLRAGLLAGLVGVVLVAIYMLLYYRALGVVVILGLAVWSALNFALICWLGEAGGLALSLAGVTGIVVSVGVTVDSYVVYFERLKDEIRAGKTIRSSVDRGFARAFRTIVTADVASLLGAALLFILTVGPVRGFALFLGISTILDLIVAWCFTRPLVNQLGRSHFFTTNPVFGVGRGLGMRAGETTEATA